MEKRMFVSMVKGQIVGVNIYREGWVNNTVTEYMNLTPSTKFRVANLMFIPGTTVQRWDFETSEVYEVTADDWNSNTRPQPMTVIRTLIVHIDRQGNRSAAITKVVEGVGYIYSEEFTYISFSTFLRFLDLTSNYEFYTIPGSTIATLVIQSETFSK